MVAPPNFIAATARAQGQNVRVSLASPPVGWGNGFEYSISPAAARSLAEQLVRAADAAERTTKSEQSADHNTGG